MLYSDSTTSQEVTIIETTTPVSTQSSRVTHSQTTDSQTTQGGPTDRQLASELLEKLLGVETQAFHVNPFTSLSLITYTNGCLAFAD